ncbi:MAG: nitroreductase family protein [Pirellulaceae bacterium]
MSQKNSKTVDEAITQRRTTKVLAEVDLPLGGHVPMDELLALAGMAPFHRACDESHRGLNRNDGLLGIEPWRFYVADAARCRRLRQQIATENAGNIPKMLASADALVLATWLPNPGQAALAEGQLFEPTLANMEHIAAASAAIQNLLVAATARGIENYWSSGGVLRETPVFELLGISPQEILLGAVFFFPQATHGAEVVGSKLRPHRTAASQWSRSL